MTATVHHEHGSLASSLGAGAGAHARIVPKSPDAKQVIPATAYERWHDHAAIVRLDVDGCPIWVVRRMHVPIPDLRCQLADRETGRTDRRVTPIAGEW